MGNASEKKEISRDLEDIKSLLILIANKSGASQPEIAKALGISDRHLRRLLNWGQGGDDNE